MSTPLASFISVASFAATNRRLTKFTLCASRRFAIFQPIYWKGYWRYLCSVFDMLFRTPMCTTTTYIVSHQNQYTNLYHAKSSNSRTFLFTYHTIYSFNHIDIYTVRFVSPTRSQWAYSHPYPIATFDAIDVRIRASHWNSPKFNGEQSQTVRLINPAPSHLLSPDYEQFPSRNPR